MPETPRESDSRFLSFLAHRVVTDKERERERERLGGAIEARSIIHSLR